jgi:DNA polymerase-3 subunit beta
VQAESEISFPPIIIPGKNLSELSKLLNGENEATQIFIGESQFICKTGNMHFHSALIDGLYPIAKNIIPRSHTTEILVDSEDITNAIERVTLLAGEGNLIRLNTTQNHIELKSMTAEVGDVHEKVGIEHLDGEDVQISFNGKYMREILRSIDSLKTTLKFSDKWKPILIKPKEDLYSTYILTPIRV